MSHVNNRSQSERAGHAETDILLTVRNLKKHFPIRGGLFQRQIGAVQAVDGISFELRRGETLGLVGGPKSGKSTAARAILYLVNPTSGQVTFAGQDLGRLSRNRLRQLRRSMQLLFQDPYASLNPKMSVGAIIREPLKIHKIGLPEDHPAIVDNLLQLVELNPYLSGRFPHEFSGGQRQRINIARALATRPELIVADELVSFLDPAIQWQIVELLRRLTRRLHLACLYIASDLDMVGYISDRIAIMYLGRIVELAATPLIYERPLHPYTQALLWAAPLDNWRQTGNRQPITLSGPAPDPARPPAACRFHPRCPYATEVCRQIEPEYRNLGSEDQPHMVACHHAE